MRNWLGWYINSKASVSGWNMAVFGRIFLKERFVHHINCSMGLLVISNFHLNSHVLLLHALFYIHWKLLVIPFNSHCVAICLLLELFRHGMYIVLKNSVFQGSVHQWPDTLLLGEAFQTIWCIWWCFFKGKFYIFSSEPELVRFIMIHLEIKSM